MNRYEPNEFLTPGEIEDIVERRDRILYGIEPGDRAAGLNIDDREARARLLADDIPALVREIHRLRDVNERLHSALSVARPDDELERLAAAGVRLANARAALREVRRLVQQGAAGDEIVEYLDLVLAFDLDS